jgi:cysteinyl-tRNA synthetase
VHIYDSVTKEKRLFTPMVEGHASLYVCGPTVYDDAHLGHAKSALVFDLLTRVLRATGLEVKYVKNITDIDDKIINKVKERGQTLQELTTFYTKRYHEDMDALNILRPDVEPKATTSIAAMEKMIQKLIDEGYAYQTQDGTVYFESSKDDKYFSLSNRRVEDEDNQSRLEDDHGKRHPTDFVMWKPYKGETDISFESSLGAGRPGWHIECSAMIEAEFGSEGDYSIDIHGGGADLLFPHHENEAAQSRCATGKELANFWVHNGFVTINGEKMSKSLGNSFFLKDALALYHPEVLRFYLLSSHYRQDFNFSEEDLKASKKRLDKLYRLKKRVYGMKSPESHKTGFESELLEILEDDLNTSKALALVDEMVSTLNETLDSNPKDKVAKKSILSNLAFLNSVLGVGSSDVFEYFQFGISSEDKINIETLIEQRNRAKKAKDFQTADAIRDQILAMDIAIMDTADGTKWEKN